MTGWEREAEEAFPKDEPKMEDDSAQPVAESKPDAVASENKREDAREGLKQVLDEAAEGCCSARAPSQGGKQGGRSAHGIGEPARK